MISIVGGSYYENCITPEWNYFYGSGLRAAAVIANFSNNVQLYTYADAQLLSSLAYLSSLYNFTYVTKPTPQPIIFNYFHPLSVPSIVPPRNAISTCEPITVAADVVLRFGMMEGDAIVSGKRVVYDPQSAEDPHHYHANGSTAEELAIVANMREGYLLTGNTCHREMAKSLLNDHGYDVVIIKRGSFGSYVATKVGDNTVPAFKTKRVWPIGSGDVYSAIFSYCWGVKGDDPFTSAEKASMGTSYYCSMQTLPVPHDALLNSEGLEPILPTEEHTDQPRLVYLAGPFFNMGQLWVVMQARTALLNQGLKVFSPLHDVGLGSGVDVAPADLEGLERSTVVLAIVNGVDPGTIFEIGYARAKGIPVIIFVQNEKAENLKMFEGSKCDIFDDFSTAIYHAAWAYHTL